MPRKKTSKSAIHDIGTITHQGERRVAIPTQDLKPSLPEDTKAPIPVSLKKRDPDLDPQLVWRGKYEGPDTFTALAPALYIQEKIHPRVIIDDLMAESKSREKNQELDLFSDFNGVPKGVDKTDFYKHDQNWTNRMILGDSLQVMTSLLRREGMSEKVQCIFMDPPYGIKFNSNFQTSTNSTEANEITREPEMIKAFRDTWSDGIHTYLTYLRERFTVAKELLNESGSIFVQIGDQNVHRVRALLDEIFGEENFESQITYTSTSGLVKDGLSRATNYLLWYCKNKEQRKYRPLYTEKSFGGEGSGWYRDIELGNGERMSINEFEERFGCKFDYEKRHEFDEHCKVYTLSVATSQGGRTDPSFVFQGQEFTPNGNWKPGLKGMSVLAKANRLTISGKTLRYVRYLEDFPAFPRNNVWTDMLGFMRDKIYVVQTGTEIVKRCILMCTDPGDLVLDPTCGSGTTAYVAEQWGRRWITIDTSRVALALARSRIMAARYPWYLLADSKEGKRKEAELFGEEVDEDSPCSNNIKFGFVNNRIPHIMLNSISNNKEIEEIYEEFQKDLEPLREELNKALSKNWQEWEIPREADDSWGAGAQKLHKEWWDKKLERQQKIDKSIEAHADYEVLYDEPIENENVVRVAGPFTVESTSAHRELALDPDNNVLDPAEKISGEGSSWMDEAILKDLERYDVQQSDKQDRISFIEIERQPGKHICAIGKYNNGNTERRAGIFIGPEFDTISRSMLVAACLEASEYGCDDVFSFGFNYEAVVTDLNNIGKINIIKAKLSEEYHMGEGTLKGGGNLFVIFGEPDIEISDDEADPQKIVVELRGVDVFTPLNGSIRSDGTNTIACWFIDTNYNGESFFVRHAYFCGRRNPYDALKRSLKAEIDKEAWESLRRTKSRPFSRPEQGRIAVKVINERGIEVMKIFDVSKK